MKAIFIIFALTISSLVAEEKNFVGLTPQSVKNLGIKTVKVQKTEFERTVFAIGHIKPIPNKHAVISTRFPGRVVQTPPIVGDIVEKDQVLLKVESRQPGSPPPVISVTAPSNGVIFKSHVTLGQPVEPAEELMDIVDLSQVWAVANIPESQMANIGIGSIARIRVTSLGDTVFNGELIRMGTEANPTAGTVEAIFLLDNPDLKLRPNMRAEFSVITSTRKDVVSVPRKAIQGDAASPFVFVKHFDIPNGFEKAPVVIGEKNDRFVEIIKGVTRVDEVVTDGSYFLGFAQGGGVSLKEALEAAHGHEHNEDGSEMTAEQKRAKEKEQSGDAAGMSGNLSWSSPIVLFLIVSNAVTLVLLTIVTFKKSAK
ncbi:multidrug resistance protein MdtA [Rubritalea halochordaticola]|uniref:Multidrug resistance protein MdtA n=1 Tax=Rubritalea halochordaticola TaxID=714537 RepID=A0ABP9UV54_9BACT